MVFSSFIFILLFFPFFFICYYVVPKKWQNLVALIGSLLFYGWGAPDFLFILLISIILDFYIARGIANQGQQGRKILIGVSVVFNIGTLFYFKYFNFFLDIFNSSIFVLFFDISLAKIVMPIGISFFTFQKMSYVIDIYYGRARLLKKISDLMLYVLLFPQLIAGPIVRYKEIARQLIKRHNRYYRVLAGLYRFIWGLSKKILIANILGAEVDRLYSNLDALNLASSWFAAICYSFQIYFDFSGYSDMAIGLGWMMGFKFPENFNNPYVSRSITEFWRRWHITLSNWMRDYLYIPLGGNQRGRGRMVFNLWIVFLLSGLWHGASWNFIIWGAFHGFFLVFEKLIPRKKSRNFLWMPLTFVIVTTGWVFFRIESLSDAVLVLKTMYTIQYAIKPCTAFATRPEIITTLAMALILSFAAYSNKIASIMTKIMLPRRKKTQLAFQAILFLTLLLITLGEIAASGFNPFIYFRF